MKQKNIFRAVFSVTGVILLAKLLGFVKQMVTAAVFGATIETDLINLSQNFVANIQYVLAQVLLTSFTAIYIQLHEEDEARAKMFGSDVLKAFSLIALVLTAIMVLGSQVISRIIAPRYSQELSSRLAGYLRLYAPVLILFVWMAVFQALLNGNQRFVPGEMVSLNQSIILVLIVFILHQRLGISALVLGFFCHVVWNTLFLGSLSKRYWVWSRGNPFQKPEVHSLLKMCGPLLLGYSMIYINQQVDKILVSGLESGVVTALTYGAVLSNLVTTFICSFCSILFTYVTTDIAKDAHERAGKKSLTAVVLLVLVFLPISILTIICARDIVSIAFQRGMFGEDDVIVTAAALSGYAFSFVPVILREVFSRFQYGYQDSRHPMINSTVGIVFNIGFSILLCPHFGVWGVTFASSISACISGLLNMRSARMLGNGISFCPVLRKLPLLVFAGSACAVTAMAAVQRLSAWSPLPRFCLTVILSAAVYLLVAFPLIRWVWKDIPRLKK